MPRLLLLLFLPLWIVACPAQEGGGSAGTSAAADPNASFAVSVLPLINKACNCHQSTPILMAPFSLKPAEAYDNLVNRPAMQLPTMSLVTPGSLNQSYLWHKVNDTQLEVGGSGLIMPSTIPLDAADLLVLERWIAAGAPR